MFRQITLVFVFLALGRLLTTAQQEGCTDPRALNFNPSASVNNGSCAYPVTVANPPFRFELPQQVKETSGLLWFNGKLWTFNDSGGNPVLYALDTITGAVVQQITVTNVSNDDWEDITMDDQYIYIGDFGNNDGTRTNLAIYKVLKSSIPINGNSGVQATSIKFSYEDQTEFIKSKNHNFDCEAVIAAGDSLYLFTKNRADQHCHIYSLPKSPGTFQARRKARFNTNGLITGADYHPVTKHIVLTGYTQKTYVPFVWLLFDFEDNNFFGGNKRRIELANLFTTQIEGVAFNGLFKVVISAEKSPTFNARVFDFEHENWTGFTSTDELKEETNQKRLSVVENPVVHGKLKIKINLLKGDFRLDILDSTGKVVRQLNLKQDQEEVIELDVSNLAQGSYFLAAHTGRRTYSSMFIIP